jgi:MFS transporter, SP family, general alpha glucoside:H+ symporter
MTHKLFEHNADFVERGVFQTLTTTYAAEVTPVVLRPYLTTYVNLCWVIGQLLAAGILKAFVSNNTQWA